MGHKQTWRAVRAASAFTLIADIPYRTLRVRFGPRADIASQSSWPGGAKSGDGDVEF
jgi:hypothetical protein